MKRFLTVLTVVAIVLVTLATVTPVASANGDVVVVEMRPPWQNNTGPFPIGWAIINRPKGEVTMLAILPRNTIVPQIPGHEELAGKWVFEGWLADLAPPHPCPIPVPPDPVPVDPTIDPDAVRVDAGDEVLVGSDEIPDITPDPGFRICGSRLSSETRFRGFPGIPNLTFQNYFPVSQGLFRRIGPPLGPWAFYLARHKTNMGLCPFDVVGVTVEPPGTGAPRRDYDPRPHPVVILIGRVPPCRHLTDVPDDGGPGDGTDPPNNTPTDRRPISGAVSVR